MKATDLIIRLERLVEQVGDIEVKIYNKETLDINNVNISTNKEDNSKIIFIEGE